MTTLAIHWNDVIDFSDYGQLLPLVRNTLIAGVLLGLVGGLFGTFVVVRDLPFAVHGVSELSFAGAAGALLLGGSVVTGSLVGSIVAGVLFAVLDHSAREKNSVIGTLMPFGLGLGILFLALYHGRAANKFGLLTGQIVAVDTTSLRTLAIAVLAALVGLCLIWRPLLFASVDPQAARSRGVPVRALQLVFMVLLAVVVAVAVQIVGALLVLALLCTPAAAAVRLSSSPIVMPLLAAGFGLVATLGGIVLSLGAAVPISPYVTTLSFLIYVGARIVAWLRERRGERRLGVAEHDAAPAGEPAAHEREARAGVVG